ncbi:hypothetical protein ABTF42_03130, partial [Acinetobacter baumannii]
QIPISLAYQSIIMAVEGRHQDEDELKANLFRALSHRKDDSVIELCNGTRDGPLYKMTLHDSTVLHMACFLKNSDLANILLDKLFNASSSEDELLENISRAQNSWGNTVLHDAVTSKKGIPFVMKLLNKVPDLIVVRNRWGESPLLQAIRYGRKHKMYLFLVEEVRKYCESHDYDL